VRYDLAMLLMMRGRYEEACAQLREVLRLDPTHGPALRQSHFC
jgi:Flp pilus assembly protein TadD